MAEAALNTRLLKALRGLHPFRVENSVLAGTPDINYKDGWIESKWLAQWPKTGSVVKVPHFTVQQRLWHRQRAMAGGVSYVCIQIEDTVLLFRGWDAAEKLGNVTEEELRELAVKVWERFLPPEEFLAAIAVE